MQRFITILYATLALSHPLSHSMESPPPLGVTDSKYTMPDDTIPLAKLKNAAYKISFIQAWLQNRFDITPYEMVFKDFEGKRRHYSVELKEVKKTLNWYKHNTKKIENKFNTFLQAIKEPIERSRNIISSAHLSPFEESKTNAIATFKQLNTLGKLLLQEDRFARYLEDHDLEPDDEHTPQIKRNRAYLQRCLEQEDIEGINKSRLYRMHFSDITMVPIHQYIEYLQRITRDLE
jgi:hypothetical protein